MTALSALQLNTSCSNPSEQNIAMNYIHGGLFLIYLVVACSDLPKIQGNIHPHGIIENENATQGELPYHVAIQLTDGLRPMCSGALAVVNDQQVVITRAYCVDLYVSPFMILAGDIHAENSSGIQQKRFVSSYHKHPRYDMWTSVNDIVLIFTTTPFDINEHVAPIPLPTLEQETSEQVIASGWWMAGQPYDILQKIEGRAISDERCREIYWGLRIQDSVICTVFSSSKGANLHRVSQSGSPIRSVDGGYLAGIGIGTFRDGELLRYPDIYTEVSYYVDWINSTVASVTSPLK